jgi:hypothetical protein
MTTPTFRKATRQGIKLLIGLFGKSGGGKTRTALELARGIVGPSGRIGLIDSERGRGSIFADIVPGGYEVMDLEAFTPEDYVAAFQSAQALVDILVIDSLTHEWNGEHGVLELQEEQLQCMAGNDYKKREACKMAAWIQPKMRHNKLIRELLRSSIPVIFCLRGKDKTHIGKDSDGKIKVTTDDFSSPIYDADFIFEMLLCGEVYAKDGIGGYFRPEKITHPAVGPLLPKFDEQFGGKHGQLLAQWAAGTGESKSALSPKEPDAGQVAAKKALWADAKPHFGTVEKFLSYLISEGIIADGQTLADLDTVTLTNIHGGLKRQWEKEAHV